MGSKSSTKKWFEWALWAFGVVLCMFSLLYLSGYSIIDYSYEKSQKIEEIFQTAAAKIDEFERINGRLPNAKEFEDWRADLSKFGLYGELITFSTHASHSDEVRDEFGRSEGDAYLLRVWRGEWSEYYASWAGRSTLPKSKSEYYIAGSIVGDVVLLIGSMLLIFGSAAALRWWSPGGCFSRKDED